MNLTPDIAVNMCAGVGHGEPPRHRLRRSGCGEGDLFRLQDQGRSGVQHIHSRALSHVLDYVIPLYFVWLSLFGVHRSAEQDKLIEQLKAKKFFDQFFYDAQTAEWCHISTMVRGILCRMLWAA